MSDTKEKAKIEIFTIVPSEHMKKLNKAKASLFHVDKEMLRFKLHFFLFNSALAVAVPYISVIAKVRIGMAASSLAAILLPQMFLFIIAKPLFGYLADYFNKMKVIIFTLSASQCIFFFLILCVPRINKTEEVYNYHQFEAYAEVVNNSASYDECQYSLNGNSLLSKSNRSTDLMATCSLEMETYKKAFGACGQVHVHINNFSSESSWIDNDHILCNLCCNVSKVCNLTACKTQSSDELAQSDFETYQFWMFALFNVLAFICLNSLFTLSDTSCCESVEKNGADFGRQRAWAAIGWGLTAPLGGFLNDYTDDYVASFTLMALLFGVSLWNLSKIDMVKPHFSQNIIKDVGTVMRSFEFLVFQFGVLLNGIAIGNIWYYTMWYITLLGGSRFLCGLVHAVQCFLGELPFFFYSGWIIKKIGHFNVITLSLAAYCARFFWYANLQNVWWILPAEIFHGLTYGLFYPAVTAYAKMNAKPGTEATTISLLFTTQEGIGAGIGCFMAGYGFDHLGGRPTYLVASLFSGLGAIFLLVMQFVLRNRKKTFAVNILAE